MSKGARFLYSTSSMFSVFGAAELRRELGEVKTCLEQVSKSKVFGSSASSIPSTPSKGGSCLPIGHLIERNPSLLALVCPLLPASAQLAVRLRSVVTSPQSNSSQSTVFFHSGIRMHHVVTELLPPLSGAPEARCSHHHHD